MERWFINEATLYKCDDVSSGEKIIAAITDANKIGTGKDSIKFEAALQTINFDYAGKRDRQTKETEEATGWSVKLEGDVLDFNTNLMGLSLMVKDTKDTSATGYDIYNPTDNLSSSDFTNIICVGNLKNMATQEKTQGIIVVKNTYNSGGLQAEFKEKDDSAWKLTFNGMYTLNGDKPFAILMPSQTSES